MVVPERPVVATKANERTSRHRHSRTRTLADTTQRLRLNPRANCPQRLSVLDACCTRLKPISCVDFLNGSSNLFVSRQRSGRLNQITFSPYLNPGLNPGKWPNIPERIRTSNLRLRRPTLYPIELRGQHFDESTPRVTTQRIIQVNVHQYYAVRRS